jgi:hypothetical protein
MFGWNHNIMYCPLTLKKILPPLTLSQLYPYLEVVRERIQSVRAH